MPDLWKSDAVDADIRRRTTKLTEKGSKYRMKLLRREDVNFMGSC